MLTPQEVSEHAFSKASFGGYNMAMVDEFLDTLTTDYTALFKESAQLKSKMKVLVDKVEEYRTTEDAMRKALLTAQRMADEMVREAEQKRDAMLAAAENEARIKIAELRQEVDSESHRLAVAKDNTSDFLTKLRALCVHEAEFLDRFAQRSSQLAPDPVESVARDIEGAMQQMTQEAPIPPEPAPVRLTPEFARREPEPIRYAPEPARHVAESARHTAEPSRHEPEPVRYASDPTHYAPEPTAVEPDWEPYVPEQSIDDGEEERPGGLYHDITAMGLRAKPVADGLREQHFEITVGGARVTHTPASPAREDVPGKRIDFDHLQFGKDYEIK